MYDFIHKLTSTSITEKEKSGSESTNGSNNVHN